jgi:hypothetical protein
MGDIPPRLSDQQKFILADASSGDFQWGHIASLSWDVAEEFGEGSKDRILDPDEERKSSEDAFEYAEQLTDDPEKAEFLATTHMQMSNSSLPDDPILTETHRASFSRSLKRLEDRELLERKMVKQTTVDGERKQVEDTFSSRNSVVVLTDEGTEAAEEIKQRVDDGRYGLNFETKPWC